jgi:hypothetical protein
MIEAHIVINIAFAALLMLSSGAQGLFTFYSD